MKIIVPTERVRIREFDLTDIDFIIQLLNSPGWLQYIGDRNVRTKEAATAYLQNGPLKSYADNGYGLWMVERIADNVPLGMTGLINRKELEHPDIGFGFLPQYNGKGYAYEAATAVLQYVRGELKISTINAITLPGNAHSIKLLEKIGLHCCGQIIMPPKNEELLLYTT